MLKCHHTEVDCDILTLSMSCRYIASPWTGCHDATGPPKSLSLTCVCATLKGSCADASLTNNRSLTCGIWARNGRGITYASTDCCAACTPDGSGITYADSINVAIAVAMPDGGLITPVLKRADQTDIYQLSRDWVRSSSTPLQTGRLIRLAVAWLAADKYSTGHRLLRAHAEPKHWYRPVDLKYGLSIHCITYAILDCLTCAACALELGVYGHVQGPRGDLAMANCADNSRFLLRSLTLSSGHGARRWRRTSTTAATSPSATWACSAPRASTPSCRQVGGCS